MLFGPRVLSYTILSFLIFSSMSYADPAPRGQNAALPCKGLCLPPGELSAKVLNQDNTQLIVLTHANQSTRQQTILTLKRLAREGAPPVILSHAFVLNFHGVGKLGRWLHEQGYDVWMPNMAGHGNGADKSRTTPYQSGDYRFDRIVSRDWPLVHQYILDQTGKKPFIIGYSIGGMTWQQYLSGVYAAPDPSYTAQSDELARLRSDKTEGFVALTVPEDLNGVSMVVKRLLTPLVPAFRNFQGSVPLTTSESSGISPGRLERVRRWTLALLSPAISWSLPSGIIRREKCRDGEFTELIKTQISSPHTDLIEELISWFDKPYASANHKVNYGLLKRVFTRTLIITASHDSLAPAKQTEHKAASLYPKETPVSIFTAQGFAHIDISFEEGIKVIGPQILKFFKGHSNPTTR